MRKIRYAVAMSLDGFIAGPNGEYDWIGTDPEIDFAAMWAQFDTFLMGRRTYELAAAQLASGPTYIVFSRTLRQQDYPKVTVVPELQADWVRELKSKAGKDIWLFGGSALFRSYLDARLVDTVEVSVIPVLLGSGLPLLPPPYTPTKLKLLSHKIYRSGRATLTYEVLQ